MASVAHLLHDASNIYDEIQRREDEAEDFRLVEFLAARRLQRRIRGVLERNHLRRLDRAATAIQRRWRGFMARRRYMRLLKEAVEEMWKEHYNNMALRIQKTWRGYYVRSRVMCFSEFKAWLEEVYETNEEMMHKMKNYEEAVKMSTLDTLDEEAKQWILFILFKLHHLLRTYVKPGILSLANTTELSYLEELLKVLRYKDYMLLTRKHRRTVRQKDRQSKEPHKYICTGSYRRCEECWINRNKPRKARLMAQGELEDICKVIEEENKKEEWVKRLHDGPMVFTKLQYNDKELRLPPGPYTVQKVRTREFDARKNVVHEKFKSIFSRIEVFDDTLPTSSDTCLLRAASQMELYTPSKRAAFDKTISSERIKYRK